MALDAVTIVGLVLGVLGLFGIPLMYNLSRRVWKLLAGRILRRRNGARDEEGLPMTSAATQVRIWGSRSSAPSQSGNTSSHSHVGAARRVSQRNDYSNTTPSTSSLFVNAPNDGRLPVTTEQRGGLRPSIVRATAVSSYPAPLARNRHHGQTTSEPQQPLDRASSDSPSTRLPRTVATTTDSTSSGTSAAAEAPQSSASSGSDRQRQRARDSQLQPLEDTTTEGETQLAERPPEVQIVSPERGPMTGGERILIVGAGFPSMLLYVRFGDAFTPASRWNQTTLQCTLPPAPCPGVVPVTLSRAPDQNAPKFGRSFATFRYEDTRIEALLCLLKLVYEKADGRPLENVITLAQQYLQSVTSTLLGQGGINTQAAENYNVLKVEELEEISIHFLSYYCKTEEWKKTISLCNKHGQTLAHISVMLGYLNLLRHLAAWGIDLNITDLQGSTALHYAFLYNKTECATLLVLSGVDELTLDELGRSPWVLNPSLVDEVTSRLRGMSRIDDSFSVSSHTMDNGCETERPEEASAHRAKYLLVKRWLKQMKEDRHSTGSLSSDPGPGFRTSPAHLPANLGYDNDSALPHILDRHPILPSNASYQERWLIDQEAWQALSQENWFLQQEQEPSYPWSGRSVLVRWLDEEGNGWICCVPLKNETWCRRRINRHDRAIVHVRGHLGLKPYPCDGRCGKENCTARFGSSEHLRVHYRGPDQQNCEWCGKNELRRNLLRHMESCPSKPSQLEEGQSPASS